MDFQVKRIKKSINLYNSKKLIYTIIEAVILADPKKIRIIQFFGIKHFYINILMLLCKINNMHILKYFCACFLGSGKTHYIKNCLPETATVISINETFNKIEIVECLKKDVTTGLGLFLNINLVWPQVSDLSF